MLNISAKKISTQHYTKKKKKEHKKQKIAVPFSKTQPKNHIEEIK